jgi:hypothetical protein
MRVEEIRPEDREKYATLSEPQIRAIVGMRMDLYQAIRAARDSEPAAAKGYELWNAFLAQRDIALDHIVKGVLDKDAAVELFEEAAQDCIATHDSVETAYAIRTLREAKQANGYDEWPDPDFGPIAELRLPAVEFDWEAVPESWRPWIEHAAADSGCSVDFTYANLLAVGSSAFGNTYRASPWGDWVEPPHLWMMCIGKPSSNKTPGLDPFKSSVDNIEKRETPKYTAALQEWQLAKEIAKVALAEWKADCRTAHKKGEPRPEIPQETIPPPKPQQKRLIVGDPSVEEVQGVLAHNTRGLVLIRSELAGWIGSFGRYSGNAAPDKSFYLEAFDGKSYVVDRVKHEMPTRLPYNSLAVVGGIQPDRLRPMFEDKNARDGFTARFIYIYPDPIAPKPRDPASPSCVGELDAALTKLWHLDWDHDRDGKDIPHVIRPDAEAAAILQRVREQGFQADEQGFDTGIVSDWRGKNPGRLLRLALTVEMLTWAKSGRDHPYNTGMYGHQSLVITGESARRALAYLKYCERMLYRALGEMAVPATQHDMAALAQHILQNRLATVNERKLYKSEGFHWLRKESVRKSTFKALVEAGWLRRIRKPGSQGGRPSGDWEVNPKVFGPKP